MNIGTMALASGAGIGTATAVGSFLAHEKLEEHGEWTAANSTFATGTQVAGLTSAVASIAAGKLLGSSALIGLGGGFLFGSQVGNLAGMGAAAIVD